MKNFIKNKLRGCSRYDRLRDLLELSGRFHKIKLFFAMLSLIMLPACHTPQKGKKAESSDHTEFQARCSDLPFPLDSKIKNKGIISNGEHDAKFFVEYTTQSSLQALQKLYHAEMEFLGWYEQADFMQQDETIFMFEKPRKIALVLVHDTGKQRHVRCYSGLKNS